MRAGLLASALVGIGALPRILLAAGTLPSPLRPFIWSDVLFTWERGLSGGHLPYWDAYFEYPPLDGYLSALFVLLGRSPVAYVALWSVVQMAAAATVAWALPAGHARWWTWSLAPQLALFGPMNFDLLAVAALVLAVRWERANTPLRATVALAVGTATKLFPAALLPVFAARGSLRAAVARFAVFAVLLVVCYAPGAFASFSTLESITRYTVGISANFDSMWGLAAALLGGLGPLAGPIITTVTLVGAVVTYVVFAIPAARSARDPATAAALAVLTLLLWSRLYSPQFSLWVLPFFALASLPLRAFVLLTIADVVVFVTVYPLTLIDAPADTLRTVLLAGLAAAIALRHYALVVAWLAARRRAGSGTIRA